MTQRGGALATDYRPGRLLTELACGAAWVALFVTLFYRVSVETGQAAVSRHAILFQLPELLAATLTSGPASSWANLIQRLDLIGIAGLVLCGAAGIARLAMRSLGVQVSMQTAEGLAITIGVGLSLWSLATLLLGVAGLLHRWAFLMLLLPAIWESGRCIRALRTVTSKTSAKRSATTSSPLKTTATGKTGEWNGKSVILLLTGPFVLAMFLGAMLPSMDFDVKEYHLGGPKEYFQNGRVGFLEHNIYTSFPFLTEMLSLSTMVLRGDWFRGALAGKLVLMTFAPITALGLFGFARRLWSPTAAVIGVVTLLTTPWVYRVSIIAYTEGALSCYLMLTVVAFSWWSMQCRDSDRASSGDVTGTGPQGLEGRGASWIGGTGRAALLLTGFLAGSAASCKYPGVLSVVIPIGVAVLWVTWKGTTAGSRSRAVLLAGMVYSAGVLLAFGPWLLKNTFETGNPVYPLVWSVFGGRGIDAAAHAKWTAGHPLPHGLWSDPRSLVSDLAHQTWSVMAGSLWQSPWMFALAPLSLLTLRRRRGVCAMLGLFCWLLLTWCWLTHRIDRFWVPMLPIVALLAGVGGGWLASAFVALRIDYGMNESHHSTWPRLVSLWLMIVVAFPLFVSLPYNLFVVTSGLGGYNQYLLDHDLAREECSETSIRLLNSWGLSENDEVLFVGDAAHFDATFRYRYHAVFNRSTFQDLVAAPPEAPSPDGLDDAAAADLELRSDAEIRSRLQQSGITVVCVNWKEILRYRHPGSYGYSGFVVPRRFQELVDRGHLEPFVIPGEGSMLPWDSLSETEQREITTWAPELHIVAFGQELFIARQFYRVRNDQSGDSSSDEAKISARQIGVEETLDSTRLVRCSSMLHSGAGVAQALSLGTLWGYPTEEALLPSRRVSLRRPE